MMKFNTEQKIQHLARAILVAAAVTSSSGWADILPKQGLSLSELKDITENEFEINFDAKTRELSFSGAVPERCLADADGDSARVVTSKEEGRQYVTLRMPGCEGNPKRIKDEKLVALSDKFGRIQLDDFSSDIMLRHSIKGDSNSKKRIRDEKIEGFHSEYKKTQLITIRGSDDILADKLKKEKAEAQARKDEEREALKNRLDKLCDSENYVGLGKEVERNARLFKDVSEVLEKTSSFQKDKFLADLNKAKDGKEAAEAFAAYRDAAGKYGWNVEELNDAYLAKRFELFDELKSDKSTGSDKIGAELERFGKELRRIDRKLFQSNSNKIALLFADLGVREEKARNKSGAIAFYEKAKEYVGSDENLKLDGRIMKLHAAGLEACLKKNPGKFQMCEKEHTLEAKEVADRIKDELSARAEDGDDKAGEQYATFSEQYVNTFGAGPAYNINGYGVSHPYMPGSQEMLKYQAVRDFQMQQQQQQMMNYQRQMMGGGFRSF